MALSTTPAQTRARPHGRRYGDRLYIYATVGLEPDIYTEVAHMTPPARVRGISGRLRFLVHLGLKAHRQQQEPAGHKEADPMPTHTELPAR